MLFNLSFISVRWLLQIENVWPLLKKKTWWLFDVLQKYANMFQAKNYLKADATIIHFITLSTESKAQYKVIRRG